MSHASNTPFAVDVMPLLLAAEDDISRRVANYFNTNGEIGFTGRFFEQTIDRSSPYEFSPSTASIPTPR